MWLWEGGVHWTDLLYWVGDLGWYGCLKGVVESDDVVAQGLTEFEGALKVGWRGLGRPDNVEVVKHCGGGGVRRV